MDTPWRIELFGGLRAQQGDRVVTRFQTQKTGALLAFLAFYRHRSHPRETLIELLWPECERDAGRNRLKVALTSLRHQLEPPGVPTGAVLVTNRAFVQLNPAACVTDVAAFESALERAARAGSGADRAQRLAEAAALYRGELLPGYVEEWILPERERLAEAYLQALDQLIADREEAGDLRGALQRARETVSADPLREEGHRELIRLLAAAGEREAALRQYGELERLLAAELAAAPDAETRALVRAIQQGRDADSTATGPGNQRSAATLAPSASGVLAPVSLPTGTVTFLLAEIEGAPALRERAGVGLALELESLQELLRPLFRGHGGHELYAGEDSLQVAFGRASDALAAAVAGQQALTTQPWPVVGATGVSVQSGSEGHPSRVRMALHTDELAPGSDVRGSPALQHATRLLLAAHGGQVLLSEKTAAMVQDALAPGLRLVDLGLLRLREAAPPERLFQIEHPELPPCEFPPPNAAACPVGHLPLSFTRFFGREEEIARLRKLLLAESTRLVTLRGPGGSGKTRLALETAGRLAPQFRGPTPRTGGGVGTLVWFVPLADLADPRLMVEKVLDALHLPRSPLVDPLEQVVGALSRQPALLLLDNFEHLVAEGVPFVRTLLERVPMLTCLVTSRQRLGLAGEQQFLVSPLPTLQTGASPAELTGTASVQLFVDRAQAVRPDFQVTPANAAALATLCQRLEGIPLALELAAARAGVLTPEQMLARLEKRFELLVHRGRPADPRHRSLWAALDWSYQLLSPELQRFFRQLTVFCGGWMLAAAEAVCGEPAALDYLEQLQACSLVLAEEPPGLGLRSHPSRVGTRPAVPPARDAGGAEMRFRLLETVREFAREQLAPEERAALERRAAMFYRELAEDAEPEVRGPDQVAWLDRLEREHDNLRAALGWSMQVGASSGGRPEAEAGLRLGAALYRFWIARGYTQEGRERLAGLLALAGAQARTAARAKALSRAGSLAHPRGDWAAAQALAEESLAIERELGNRQGMPTPLNTLGNVAADRGNFGAARSLYEESLAIGRELGDKSATAWALLGLGNVALFQGDDEAARALYEESLATWRQLGDKRSVTFALSKLGFTAFSQGDYGAAQALLHECLAIQRELDDQWNIATSLRNLGDVACSQGNYRVARAFYEKGLTIQRAMGDRRSVSVSLRSLGDVACSQGNYGVARALYEESLAVCRELGLGLDISISLRSLGAAVYCQGDYETARTLYHESLTIQQALGDKLGDRRYTAESLAGLAAVARAQGRPEQAARLFGAAQALRDALGAPLPPNERANHERDAAAARAALGAEAFAAAWAAGQALSLEQALDEALGDREGRGRV